MTIQDFYDIFSSYDKNTEVVLEKNYGEETFNIVAIGSKGFKPKKLYICFNENIEQYHKHLKNEKN